MSNSIKLFFEHSLFFLLLINPVSKILFLSGISKKDIDLRSMILRATATGLIILLSFGIIGNFLLKYVFHVELFSLQIVGGIILFLIGLRAVSSGEFFESKLQESIYDTSIVPLGFPMIAGPGTITTAIYYSTLYGHLFTSIVIMCAIVVNFFIMLSGSHILNLLKKIGIISPLVRITGFLVASMGIDMVLKGIKQFVKMCFC